MPCSSCVHFDAISDIAASDDSKCRANSILWLNHSQANGLAIEDDQARKRRFNRDRLSFRRKRDFAIEEVEPFNATVDDVQLQIR